MLTATLTWPGKITATGITLTNREPMLALCRALVSAGHADQPMTVIDAATGRPVMHIQSIAKALMRTVGESGGCRGRFRIRVISGHKGIVVRKTVTAQVPPERSG